MTRPQISFRREIQRAGLTQSSLARFLGKDPVTVNRWCRSRADSLTPPKYARAFVAAYSALTKAARERLAAQFDTR